MKRPGFTLVELLVVLGIIAMLTAVIFAALGPARERGREVACLNQMHQWGLAFAMYTQDYGGVEPVKGVEIPPSKLGMPFDSDALIIPYHLEHMINCPSTHWPPGKPKREIPRISYPLNMAVIDDDWNTEHIAEYGLQYPLMECFMHNADVDFVNQPTWAKKRLLVLRWDQHLEREMVPVHTGM